MNKVIVIAPHPDDETLGCGGSILRHINNMDEVYWLIMTTMETSGCFSKKQFEKRTKEIEKVAANYGFRDFIVADFPSMELDTLPKKNIVDFISKVFEKIEPSIVYAPFSNDVHSDHKVVFGAISSCTKSFRHPYIQSVRLYETISETEFDINPNNNGFKPNLWIDISSFIENKLEIMSIYEGELSLHPFPRSKLNIRALASFRGSTAGVEYAESFIIVKEVMK